MLCKISKTSTYYTIIVLETHLDNGILHLALNRPDKRNALNRQLVEELIAQFVAVRENKHIRGIVLTGNGDVFSAGADLAALKQLQTSTHQENLEDSQVLARLFHEMYQCDVPIIGAINGHAIAGGCGLVTMCDISIAVENAKLGYTETRIGFVPAIVTKFLQSKISETHARRLLFAGILISAREACEIGLITEVTTHLDFQHRIDYWTQVFTSEVSPQAVVATKKLLRDVAPMGIPDSITHATQINATARGTTDCKKGISAFLNKEKLKWD